MEAGEDPTPAEQIWLAAKAEEYGLAAPDFAQLERRVDIIPPSLALAQSAEESGWGPSLSRIVLEESAAQLAGWLDQGHLLDLHVLVPRHHLDDPATLLAAHAACDRTREGARLVVETGPAGPGQERSRRTGAPAPEAGDGKQLALGKRVYDSLCAECHGARGAATPGPAALGKLCTCGRREAAGAASVGLEAGGLARAEPGEGRGKVVYPESNMIQCWLGDPRRSARI